MAAVRKPRTLKAATLLLERLAVVEGAIGAIEAERKAELAAVHAEADGKIEPWLPERDDLVAKLSGWWSESGHLLTEGKRKSMTIGGCEIGSRKHPDKLGIAGDATEIAKLLQKKRWAGELVVTTVSVDRAAVLKSIDGAHADELKAMGFSRVEGDDVVFVRAVAPQGTLGSA